MRVPEILLTPGPVTIGPEVQRALGSPVRASYGEDWAERYQSLERRLAEVFRTGGDVVLLFGPGSAALEACLGSALGPGDEVLVAGAGLFAERLATIATALRLRVRAVAAEPLAPVRPEEVERALRRYPGCRALAVVYHETSIGLLNPVREICDVARQRGLLTIVDAVSALGGIPLEVDAWGLDLCVGVANKCLGGPVGIAPVAVSGRAWEAIGDGRPKAAGWYLNLATWRRFGSEWGRWHPHPTTMPSNVLDALETAVGELLAEGLDAHQARLAAAAARVRRGLRELGFELVAPDEHASPVTTAVWALPGMDVNHYLGWLRARHGLRVGGGIGQWSGRLFRVGHMGRAAEPEVVRAYLEATAEYLEEGH
jgi:alanine-glyoxylate transaminase/serine-glyoxylate transaminase/serine-pyruvate transaminase